MGITTSKRVDEQVGALGDEALLDCLIRPLNPLASHTWDEQVVRETLHRIFVMLKQQK